MGKPPALQSIECWARNSVQLAEPDYAFFDEFLGIMNRTPHKLLPRSILIQLSEILRVPLSHHIPSALQIVGTPCSSVLSKFQFKILEMEREVQTTGCTTKPCYHP